MGREWDPALYRERAREWQARAAVLPEGEERAACLSLAAGYTHLAELLEKIEANR